MITAAIDSTTKKGVGQFATQGLSIGRNTPFPLPLLPICGESTEDVASQVAMGMEVLAAVNPTSRGGGAFNARPEQKWQF